MTTINDLLAHGANPDAPLVLPNLGGELGFAPLSGIFSDYYDEAGVKHLSLGYSTTTFIKLRSTKPESRIRVEIPDVIAGISLTHDEARALRAQIDEKLPAEPPPVMRVGARVKDWAGDLATVIDIDDGGALIHYDDDRFGDTRWSIDPTRGSSLEVIG